jgi:hypothetical protein
MGELSRKARGREKIEAEKAAPSVNLWRFGARAAGTNIATRIAPERRFAPADITLGQKHRTSPSR